MIKTIIFGPSRTCLLVSHCASNYHTVLVSVTLCQLLPYSASPCHMMIVFGTLYCARKCHTVSTVSHYAHLCDTFSVIFKA